MNMPLLFQVHVVVVFHRNGLFHAYNSPILTVQKRNVLIRVDIRLFENRLGPYLVET